MKRRIDRRTDAEWAADKVARFPAPWARELLGEWGRRRSRNVPGGEFIKRQRNEADANRALLKRVAALESFGVSRLDESDDEIVSRAHEMVKKCMDMAKLYSSERLARIAVGDMLKGAGINPPSCRKNRPALLRMFCEHWMRRQIRRTHARAVEGAAIALGMVNKRRQIYCSDVTLDRRIAQNKRNAEAMAATVLENEDGEQFTLAELSAKSTANKSIRRGELMTRIAGFERVAIDMGHAGVFLTVTCPSRMHKFKTVRGGGSVLTVENRRYDGTLPNEAQAYLCRVWARARAALHRKGIQPYGFRIAEPNHDGTPHWHMLLFVEREQLAELCEVVRGYALMDSPDEPGAKAHRVDIKEMDAAKGTAAGYIAKYVAKNIDGYRVGQDLFGNDAMETSARVEAWASAWRIRQFQQIGGAPVTPWRELRRVRELPENAPDHLRKAHAAVNRVCDMETGEVKSVAWDAYTRAQGGPTVGREYKIKVMRAEPPAGDMNRYEEQPAGRVLGVMTVGIHPQQIGQITVHLPMEWLVESARKVWRVVKNATAKAGQFLKAQGEALSPWTCVNNCTPNPESEAALRHGLAAAQEQEREANKTPVSKTSERTENGTSAGETAPKNAQTSSGRSGDDVAKRPRHCTGARWGLRGGAHWSNAGHGVPA